MPARLLIVYATSEGQTARIADRLALLLRESGVDVIEVNIHDEQPDPSRFDAVVIGASVHGGSFQAEARQYAERNRKTLSGMPSWFFGVSLSEAGTHPPMDHPTATRTIEAFLAETAWTPRGWLSVAGAVKYREYSWLKRQLMKSIVAKYGPGDTDTSRDYEYTDWAAVDAFAAEIAASLTPRASVA